MKRPWMCRSAERLAAWSSALIPASHDEWRKAMRAELQNIDDPPAALWFSLGCAWTSLRLGFRSVPTLLILARAAVTLGLGCVAVAVLASQTAKLVVAITTSHHVPVGPTLLLYTLGLLYAGGAIAIAARGPRMLARVAAPLFALHVAALAWLGTTDAAHPLFYLALAIEGASMWCVLFCVAFGLSLLEQRANRARPS